jgi:pyruvate/2-oxoglutarate dehydrogenase complex dihydrolipoamide acyltransferase (E2) component
VRGALLAALGTLAAAPAARAESLYVVEQVVVNVNSAPDASGERIATVKSGERMEVIERVRDQVHVQLPGGKDGWIRASYLSADEPLKPRLAASSAEVARLKEELSHAQAQLAGAHPAPAPSAPATTATPPAAAPAAAPEPSADSSRAPQRALFEGEPEAAPRRLWPWALGSALIGLALGFALGALVLDRHIRRKYGGLRIY